MGTRTKNKESETTESLLERRTYTVAEAAILLGISRSTAYECVRSGEIQSVRFRSRIVIPATALADLIAVSDQIGLLRGGDVNRSTKTRGG